MAGQRIISKQLAGVEDLLLDALGETTVQQKRASGVRTITKINSGTIPLKGRPGESMVSIKDALLLKLHYVPDVSNLPSTDFEIYPYVHSDGSVFAFDPSRPKTDADGVLVVASTVDENDSNGCYIRLYDEIKAEWFGSLSVEATYIKAASFGIPVRVPPGDYSIDEDTTDLSSAKFYSFGEVTISNHSTLEVKDLVG